jgi:DNA-binding XRE family transcriptional regulator
MSGKQLKQWRNLSGMTQKTLAERLVPPLAQITICHWEKGKRAPTLSQAVQLEGISGGHVKASSWGYSEPDIQKLRENTRKR